MRYPRLFLLGLAPVMVTTAIVAAAPTAALAASTVYQAENATIGNGVVEANHAGYTGTGFVNFNNVTGSSVQFSVTATASGPHQLGFRTANGTATNRPMSVAVNGATVVAGVAFESTGNWDTWTTATVPVTLAAGTNTIRVTATTANGGPNLDSLTVTDGVPPATDWSRLVIGSTMARYTPSSIGGWDYTVGLYLWGQYLVYQRTHDAALLSYIRAWADRFVDANGTINNGFNDLDSMQSGNVLLALYHETGAAKYRTAATKIRNRLSTYPRTADGGLWHATSADKAHQLWADGVYMVTPFLAHYGQWVGDATAVNDEATRQLAIYQTHLDRPNGLLRHGYDENKAAGWADPATGQSPEHWCRAIGWFAMSTVDVLDAIPATHPRRAALVGFVQRLAAAFRTYQDPASGRWFQVVDKGGVAGNWTETSCSSMYVYMMSKGVEQGYLDAATYRPVIQRGYVGVIGQVSVGTDGRTNIVNICVGTGVGNSYAYYIGRPRATNDFHGLGAFLIMQEQIFRTGT